MVIVCIVQKYYFMPYVRTELKVRVIGHTIGSGILGLFIVCFAKTSIFFKGLWMIIFRPASKAFLLSASSLIIFMRWTNVCTVGHSKFPWQLLAVSFQCLFFLLALDLLFITNIAFLQECTKKIT